MPFCASRGRLIKISVLINWSWPLLLLLLLLLFQARALQAKISTLTTTRFALSLKGKTRFTGHFFCDFVKGWQYWWLSFGFTRKKTPLEEECILHWKEFARNGKGDSFNIHHKNETNICNKQGCYKCTLLKIKSRKNEMFRKYNGNKCICHFSIDFFSIIIYLCYYYHYCVLFVFKTLSTINFCLPEVDGFALSCWHELSPAVINCYPANIYFYILNWLY